MPFVGPLLEEGTCGILRAHTGSIPGVPLYHTRSKDGLPLAQCCRVTPPAMSGPSFPPPGPPVHTSPLSFPHLSFSCPWLLPFDVPFLFFQRFLLPLVPLPFSSPSFCFGGLSPAGLSLIDHNLFRLQVLKRVLKKSNSMEIVKILGC